MTKLTLALVLSVAIAGLSADAGAAESEEKSPVVQAAADCRPETESFDVLLDVSGSMMRVDPASDEEDRESGYSKARRFLMRLAGDADMSIPSGLSPNGFLLRFMMLRNSGMQWRRSRRSSRRPAA